MIIDAHYHLETRIESVEELLAGMDKNGIRRTALIPTMVEPFQMSRTAGGAGDIMRKLLIGKANFAGRFFYRTTVDPRGNFVLLTRKYKIYDTPDNGEVAAVVEKYPERFVAWVFVNPAVQDAEAEAECWMERPGAIGVKAHPFWHRYPVAKLEPVADLCNQKAWPLLIHLGGDKRSGDYKKLPELFPNLNIVYAHAGVPFYRELWHFIKTKKNVYVDISSPYLNEALARMAVKELGADKCIFGSDGPYGFVDEQGKYDHSVIKGWIERLPISDTEKEKILGANFMKIARK